MSKEFYGMYAYYILEVNQTKLTVFHRESKTDILSVGDSVFVEINEESLLKYKR